MSSPNNFLQVKKLTNNIQNFGINDSSQNLRSLLLFPSHKLFNMSLNPFESHLRLMLLLLGSFLGHLAGRGLTLLNQLRGLHLPDSGLLLLVSSLTLSVGLLSVLLPLLLEVVVEPLLLLGHIVSLGIESLLSVSWREHLSRRTSHHRRMHSHSHGRLHHHLLLVNVLERQVRHLVWVGWGHHGRLGGRYQKWLVLLLKLDISLTELV